jgi:L-iditol 2-dehydrogenase
MQSAVLTESLAFAFEERSVPDPAPEEVLVAISDVGICGSDVHYYRHGRIGEYVVDSPLVLGHESAGEVVKTGPGVTDLAVGMRVTIEPGVPCRRCSHCKEGKYNRCPNVTFMATPPDDGAFREFVAWPADFVYEIPDPVSTRAAALCEPLSVGIHACRRGSVGIGETVAISGGGPIGLLAMDAARAAGASEIILSDVVSEKLAIADKRGADRTIDASSGTVVDAIEEYTDGEGADVVIEASGAEPAIRSAFDSVCRGGTVVLIGLASEATIPIDVLSLIDNEIDVYGSFRYRNTYRAALAALEDGQVDVEGLIDFERPLSDIEGAFEQAMAPETVKGMITISE